MGWERGYVQGGRKENEEGVDGFIWSGELANCSTIEERISRRIRAVGRIANSAVASLSRSLANIPSIFLRSSCLCDLQSLRLAHIHTKIYTRNNKKYIYIHTRTREMQAFRAPHFRLSQDPRSTRFRIFDKIQLALRIPVSILSLFYFLFFFYYYYFFSSLELKIVKLFKQKKNKSKAEFVASVGL